MDLHSCYFFVEFIALSSFALRHAASTASIRHLRNPPFSSWWMASIVVPPGEQTSSLSSDGCFLPSKTSFADPWNKAKSSSYILKRKRNLPPFKPVNINNNTACSKCVNLFVDNSVLTVRQNGHAWSLEPSMVTSWHSCWTAVLTVSD